VLKDWEYSVEHHIELGGLWVVHKFENPTPEKVARNRSCYDFQQTTMKLKHNDDRKARINELKSRPVGAGKGDRPRPITSKYWDNYGEIDWSKKPSVGNKQ
jgi:hypothetical protein